MSHNIFYMLERIIAYNGLNLMTNNFLPASEGVPIYLSGQLVYTIYFEDIKLFEGQIYAFAGLWQLFFDSIFLDETKDIILDTLQAVGSVALQRYLLCRKKK